MRDGGVLVFAQAALYQRLFRQYSVSLIPVRQRQVVLAGRDENVPLVPDRGRLHRPQAFVSRLSGQQESALRGEDSAEAGLPTQSNQSLGAAVLAGPFLLH